MKAEQRRCVRECPVPAESGGGVAVEEEVQKGGGGGAAAAACVTAAGIEVCMLHAKKATNAEEGGMGDVALHKMPCVGLVAEEGMELVVAAVRVLAGPVGMKGGVNVMGWGVGGERACGQSSGGAPGAALGGDCSDGGMEGGRDGCKEAGRAGESHGVEGG